MNEFQAALGLLQLKYIDQAIQKRKEIADSYRKNLRGLPGISAFEDMPDVRHNYQYFPIVIDKGLFGRTRDEVYESLKKRNIIPRRYFYPLISQFPTYRGLDSAQPGNLPIAEDITQKILCLPIYPDLELDSLSKIINIIKMRNPPGIANSAHQ